MNLGKKEGIVVVGEIQKREIMPLTLGIDRGSRKTFEGKRSFIVSYSIRMWDQRRGKEALQLRS